MKNFEGFGLSPALNTSLAKMNYTSPTPVQEMAIPLGLKGHDILGSAQTGTGKTAAFSIPLVEALLRSPHGSALVMTPTRELAKQVLEVIHQLLGHNSPIKTAFIIGGEHMGKQFTQLRANPRIIVGTPGRINDHLERGSMKLGDTKFLVLDETDRMLDMGFGVQLDRIMKYLPAKRQTLMFSATLPKGIVQLSSKYLTDPKRVSMGATNVVASNIKQDILRIEQSEKYKELLLQLHEREGTIIVFAKTKHSADKIAKNLRRDGFTSDALHGDLRQNKRDKVMRNYRAKNFRILVATDIAARGLDVPHIQHVINYDLPQVAEDYIHRMGRTARAGAGGSALCFISSQDSRKWNAIEQLLNPSASNDKGNYTTSRKKHNGKGSASKSKHRPFKGKSGNGESRNNESRRNKYKSGESRNNENRGNRSRNSESRNNENHGNRFENSKPHNGNKSRNHKPRRANTKPGARQNPKASSKPGQKSFIHKAKKRRVA